MHCGHPQLGANFDSRFFFMRSREEREGKFPGFFEHWLEEDSAATEFRPLRIFRVFCVIRDIA
jgi:hypothetical protein